MTTQYRGRQRSSAGKRQPPAFFRTLLWSLRWKDVDVTADKEDIIVSAVNEGTLVHWGWIIRTYGKAGVRAVLRRRLISEFHPESRNLARVVFAPLNFLHARDRTHKRGK